MMIDDRCYRVRFEDREAGGAQRHRHHRISLIDNFVLCGGGGGCCGWKVQAHVRIEVRLGTSLRRNP